MVLRQIFAGSDNTVESPDGTRWDITVDDTGVLGTTRVPEPPDTPSNLSATAGDGSVTLDWDDVSDTTSYEVFRSTVSPVDTSGAALAAPTTSDYVDDSAVNGTTYFYVVRAVNADGPSGTSVEVSATPEPPPPLDPSVLPAIGEPFMGGFFAGVIDTTQDNIIAADAYQTGERYALIVSPKSLEFSAAFSTQPSPYAPAPEARTRWNGLEATRALASDPVFEAFVEVAALSAPDDEGSEWYVPALDEGYLLYWNLKPSTDANGTGERTGWDFPSAAIPYGENLSSDPTRPAQTANDPSQTSVAVFQAGGAEAFSTTDYIYLAVEALTNGTPGVLTFEAGWLSSSGPNSLRPVRPVRRVSIA